MHPAWNASGGWWLHTALGGGLVLLVSWLAGTIVRQPARRQWLGECGVLAALLIAVLGVAPAWLIVAWPAADPASGQPAVTALPAPPKTPRARNLGASQAVPWPAFLLPGPYLAKESQPSVPTSTPPGAAEKANAPVADHSNQPAPPTATVSEPALPPATEHARGTPATRSLLSWLLILYGSGVLFFLGRWLVGQVGLWRLVREGRPAPVSVRRLFRTLTGRQGHRPRLLVSPRLSTPVSFGLLRPTIVLPAALCCPVDPQTLRWVFVHELTHLRRGDPWSCLLFSLGRAVYFYVPWFWPLCRSVRLCQEYIADATAARSAAWPDDYAQFLLGLNGRPAIPAGAFGVFGSTSDLFRRIRMLLQPSQRVDGRCPRPWALVAIGGLTALAIVLGGLDVRSQAASPQQAVADSQPTPSASPQPAPWPTAPRPGGPQGMMPPGGMMPPMMGMPGGAMGNRLGAYLERPGETLIAQLDLPRNQGLVLAHVQPGSAAAKAGFKSHDILLQLNGKAVSNNPWQLDNQLRALKPDQKIDAVVLRKGHKKTIKDFTLPEARFGGMPGMAGMGGTANMQQMMRMMQMGQHAPGMAPPGGPPGMMGPGMPGMPGRIMNSVTAVATSSNGVMTTLFKSNDHFTARHQEGNLIITVEGKTPGRKADVNEITVQDGPAKSTYKSVDKVPTRYRDKVKNLVELSAGNNAKIKVTAPAEDKHAEEGPLNRGEKK